MEIEKNKSNGIKFGIDAEVESLLNLYCKDGTEPYLPWSFRKLTIFMLESLRRKPETWSEFDDPMFEVNNALLQELIRCLQDPDYRHITVQQRNHFTYILRTVSLSRKKFGLGNRLPNFCDQSDEWPSDVSDQTDLFDSISRRSLRSDVKEFIWKILDEVIPNTRYCCLHYFGGIKSSKYRLPIVVEVTEDYEEVVKDRIVTVSNRLRDPNIESLLPMDVVEIVAVPVRGPVVAKKEGFVTSGSPWKERSEESFFTA